MVRGEPYVESLALAIKKHIWMRISDCLDPGTRNNLHRPTTVNAAVVAPAPYVRDMLKGARFGGRWNAMVAVLGALLVMEARRADDDGRDAKPLAPLRPTSTPMVLVTSSLQHQPPAPRGTRQHGRPQVLRALPEEQVYIYFPRTASLICG